MNALLDKLILLAGCFLLLLYDKPNPGILHVLGILWAVTFLCICTCCNPDCLPLRSLKKQTRAVLALFFALYVILSLCSPFFGIFLVLSFYEQFLSARWYFSLIPVLTAFLSQSPASDIPRIPVLLLFLLGGLLKYKTLHLLKLERDFKLLRDTSTEYSLLLRRKNKDLIQRQDYEIHVATLQERNRIAREIHDNVGHMLARSILQSGALLALNQDDQLKEPLTSLKDTLSHAMDSIRKSVHDLHDDSIDLKASISALLEDFKDYDTQFDYDMGTVIPRQIKYCFISIVKESLSNIVKHSNATHISITVREHPSLYQLMITDNGTGSSTNNSGIGLENMRERAEALQGHFSVTTENGFRIFISIPRKNNTKENRT